MIRRVVILASTGSVLSLLLIGVLAAPAAAHGVGGVEPSNYETTLQSVDPPRAGVEVRVIDLGDRLEVVNRTAEAVVVLGYEGEPYLRIGPDGVFENQRSPAVWANRDRYGNDQPAPPLFDVDAAPDWVRVSTGDTARFHWHLAHWMSRSRPGVVDADPDREQVLADWTLRIEGTGETIVASGQLRWVPAPSPVPFLLAGVACAVVVVVAGRTRHWRWLLVSALAVLVVVEAVHIVGLWSASTSGLGRRLLENVYSIAGIGLAIAALVRLADRRRDPYDGTPLALLAGIVLAIAGGLADLATLSSSQLPTDLAPSLARLLIAVTLGVGVGVVVTAATKLRRPAATSADAAAPS